MNLHYIIKKLFKEKSETLKKYMIKYEKFTRDINILDYPKHVIINCFMVSLAGNILAILSLYFIVLSLGIQVGLLAVFIIFPLVTVISMIPISINGIGLREGAFVFFLKGYSVSSVNAVAISVLYFSTIIFLGILGGIIFLFLKLPLEEINSQKRFL